MKTEELIREYMRTHESDENIAKRVRIQKAAKPATPITRKGR